MNLSISDENIILKVVDIVDMFSKATRRRTKTRTDDRSQDRSMMMMAEESRDSSLLLVKPEPLDMEGVIVPMINGITTELIEINEDEEINEINRIGGDAKQSKSRKSLHLPDKQFELLEELMKNQARLVENNEKLFQKD